MLQSLDPLAWRNHLVMALLPLLVGSLLGLGLAALVALVARQIPPPIQRVLAILPWRAGIAAGILTMLWSPFLALQYGGTLMIGMIIMTMVVCMLAVPRFVAIFSPPPTTCSRSERVIASVRTLLVMALTVPAITDLWITEPTVRMSVLTAQQRFDLEQIIIILLVLIGLLTLVDSLLGIVQAVVGWYGQHRGSIA